MSWLGGTFTSGGFLNILGVRVDPVSMRPAVDRIVQWATATSGQTRVVVVAGAHGLVEAWREPSLRDLINRADLVVPDGMPLVWVGRGAGQRGMDRVFGPDLMLEVCAATVGRAVSHFFCGGPPGRAAELAARLSSSLPGLQVGGVFTPPMGQPTREDFQAMAGAFKRSGARIFWMGVSTPKQEQWIDVLRRHLDTGVLIGAGAAFDYNTGRIRRAPRWMQRSGLEWLARLAQDPRRLLRRYFSTVPLFSVLLLLQLVGLLHPARPRAGSADQ